MTIADELRTAAKAIRDTAAAATPGPWTASDHTIRQDHTGGHWTATAANEGNATHIAMWNPTVAGLVADLLDNVSSGIDRMLKVEPAGEQHFASYYRHEVALAKAINGSAA